MRGSVLAMALMALMALTACGKVVTPQPTASISAGSTVPAAPTVRPTATAPITPPPATATPAATATPVIHVVQGGETLLSIAFDYGVSLQVLQDINRIENPQLLQVGQSLIIPTGGEETGVTPGLLLPTPTPLPFGVRGVAFYETPVGSLWCLGEIVNTTASSLTNVQVRVALFDAAGQPLTQADAFAAASVIPPGERSPFGILFTSPPAAPANPQVTILRGEDAGALTASYVPMAVTQVQAQPSGSQMQVTGTVQNTSADQATASVYVIVTTYDAQGLVTGYRQEAVKVEGEFAPGATIPFSMLFTFYGDTPADFNAIALGRVPSE